MSEETKLLMLLLTPYLIGIWGGCLLVDDYFGYALGSTVTALFIIAMPRYYSTKTAKEE